MIRGLPQRISVAVPVDLTGALMVEMWIKDMGSKETTYHTLPDIDVENGSAYRYVKINNNGGTA